MKYTKEQIRQHNRKDYLKHREARIQSAIDYDKKNPEKVRARTKEWAKTIRGKFNAASSADKRGFSITFEEYKNLILQGCHYCKNKLVGINGLSLDLIDNSKGYTLDNVLPCCGRCNKTRGNMWTVEQTEIMIKAVLGGT